MKTFLSILSLAAGLWLCHTGHAAAAFTSWCSDDGEPVRAQAPDAAEIAAHRRFDVPVIHYTGRLDMQPGFAVSLRVDSSGRVTCIDSVVAGRGGDDASELAPFIDTEERMGLLKTVGSWRYRPFTENGRPVAVIVTETIAEDIRPSRVAMPSGSLYATTIILRRTGCFGTCPSYTVTLRGDGEVVFEGREYTDVAGRLRYRVSPGAVAALIERLRAGDLWSMRRSYSAAMTDGAAVMLTMTVGGRTKSVTDYYGESAGMPPAVATMQSDIDATSGAAGLVDLNPQGIAWLAADGFAFDGPDGADLLVRAVMNPAVEDATLIALMARGTPLHGGQWRQRFSPEESSSDDDAALPALDAALLSGREQIVPRLIEGGALWRDGVPDPVRVDSAFRSAVASGRLAMVQVLWAWHPSLTYRDEDGVSMPVTLLLGGIDDADRQDFAIARLLIEAGCDINSKNGRGETLLHKAAQGEDPAYVRWLLDRGADVKSVAEDGETALTATYDEAIALMLLEAGADPAQAPRYRPGFFFYAQDYKWKRVITWLEGHGYGEQLRANQPPARP